jgi:radical SAM superfamily enzyme YgiQ (UPF0313 family)
VHAADAVFAVFGAGASEDAGRANRRSRTSRPCASFATRRGCASSSHVPIFARQAYALADRYRALGVRVVAGGPHVSYWTEQALAHVDAVVVGEAESAWRVLLRDVERGALARVYRVAPRPLEGLPTPRYDLLEDRFVVPRVVQATRGCPFTCSFCTVPDLNPGFRVRPVGDV